MAVAGVVKMAIDRVTTIVDRISDPRVHEWPLMSSPIPTLMMVLTYLYIVVILGPRIMANRKPFKLRRILIGYNAFQVVFSSIMLYEHLMSGWLSDYSYKCQPVDYSYNHKAVRMLNLCWWYYISKLTEFADTIFFILRKKDSQVTFLHLYHHSLTPIETWVLVKFIAGGHGTFSNLINNIVHVVMYFYYMMSAMGPEYQKYLWWKKHLTHIQLLQFTLVFFHSWSGLFNECGYPKIISAFLIFHSVVFFVLFGNFYLQTYNKVRSGTASIQNSKEVNGAITNGTIKNGTIPNGTVTNGCIANGKIANGALVTNGKIPNGTISNGHVSNGNIPNGTLTNGTISNGTIQNGTIPNGAIQNGTIPNFTIQNGGPLSSTIATLTYRKIVNGTIPIANGTPYRTPNGVLNTVNGTVPNGVAYCRQNGVSNGIINHMQNGVPNGTIHATDNLQNDENTYDRNKKD